MSDLLDRQTLLALLGDDQELFQRLFDLEILPPDRSGFSSDEAQAAFIARTLVRELEVNWAGVEIILRLRSELLATRRQTFDLLGLLRQQLADPEQR